MAIASIKDAPGSIGTISYNGVSFGVFRNNLRLRGEPVYDDAERVVTHVRYTLSIHTIISSDDDESALNVQQTTMGTVQDKLSQPGRTLTIQDIGFDTTLTTQAGGTKPDLIWGAKPRIIEMRPLGGQIAWELIWECEFNVSRCASGGMLNGQYLMAFNYDMTFAIDDEGLTTRVISGYAQIPIVRGVNASRDMNYNVDDVWDRISLQIPAGFRRVQNVRKINAAKNRLDFNIIDKELSEEPYPAGIIKCDLQEERSSIDKGFATWSHTIGGTITVAPGYPPSLGPLKFFAILFNRISKIRAGLKEKESLIPMQMTIGRKMFSRTSNFHATFRLNSCMEELLAKSGMWSPVPDTSYTQWIASMNDKGIIAPRGYAGLRVPPAANELVDLCASIPAFSIPGGGVSSTQVAEANLDMLCGEITEAKSYLYYETKIRVYQEQQVVHHKPAAQFTPPTFGPVDILKIFGGFTTMPLAGIAEYLSSGSSNKEVTQFQSEPVTYVLLQGQALRMKWHPAALELTKLGGVELQEVKRIPMVDQAASFFGCPAYKGRWAILYRASGPISSMKAEKVPGICNHEET